MNMSMNTTIWPRRRANLFMGVSVATLGAMATPGVRQQVHEMLGIKEEYQVAFDVVVVGAATALGLYSLYQRGRRDATNFILSAPEPGVKDWMVTEGAGKHKDAYAWNITALVPREG